MGSAFNKEVVRSITQSAGRFAAIAIISLLGAGVYAGLRMSAPDMRLAADEFFDATRFYDISVMTTLGVDDAMIEALRDVEGVGAVMPTYRTDVMAKARDVSYATCVESLPMQSARASDTSDGVHALSDDEGYLNRPILVQGAWPANPDECVVAVDAATEIGIAVGDTLQLEQREGDFGDVLAQTQLVVTGLVNSPSYISSATLGPTSIGAGTLDLYLFVGEDAFSEDVPYSAAYLSVPAAEPLVWDSPEYDRAVGEVRERIAQIAPELGSARRQAVKDDIHHELLGVFQELAVSLDWSEDIDEAEVFVMDRSKNTGVASLSSDAEGITKIALYLPFMFFLVAALVSLTSMTRMVDEERQIIGTHKALGYGKAQITSKYLVYGVLASFAGSAAGVFALGKLLPWFILVSYGVSYAVPIYPTPIDAAIAARAIGLSVGVTALATWGAAAQTLRSRPAVLMVPRAPKAGKRIILERIGPLWRAMSFSHKVTARNLLRYKRRFFMAVVGIAGCTALLMVGFGLRDAIGGIVSNQYEVLMDYDALVRIDDDAHRTTREELASALESPAVESHLALDGFNLIAQGPEDDVRIEVVVPADPERLADFIALRNRETGEALRPDGDGLVLTEKAATMLGVSAGDSVVLFDENDVGDKAGDGRTFTVDGIAENYLGHYAYLSPSGYEKAFGEQPVDNSVYLKVREGADAGALSDALLAINGVNTVSFVADKIVTYEDMLDVMNKLIYVIMLLSAGLAFVVIYNLTNINIGERIREIATLKVLGFTRGEVNAYIFREVMVMALIGALLGCVLGVPLTFYIAEAAETAVMMFGRVIEPASFVASFVLTMAFAAIVMFFMRRKLVGVDMVESLKSIE